jgi:hypothetical protein
MQIGEATMMPKGYTKQQVDDYIWAAYRDLCPWLTDYGYGD